MCRRSKRTLANMVSNSRILTSSSQYLISIHYTLKVPSMCHVITPKYLLFFRFDKMFQTRTIKELVLYKCLPLISGLSVNSSGLKFWESFHCFPMCPPPHITAGAWNGSQDWDQGEYLCPSSKNAWREFVVASEKQKFYAISSSWPSRPIPFKYRWGEWGS